LNPFAKRYKVNVKSEFESGSKLLKKIDDSENEVPAAKVAELTAEIKEIEEVLQSVGA